MHDASHSRIPWPLAVVLVIVCVPLAAVVGVALAALTMQIVELMR